MRLLMDGTTPKRCVVFLVFLDRLLDVDRLLSLLGTEDVVSFRKNLNAALALAIENRPCRER